MSKPPSDEIKFCLVRSPVRVSLFGGGTDYPEFFNSNKGAVIGCAINKYIYFGMLSASNFVDYKYRLAYSILNTTNSIEGIEHPLVKKALEYYVIDHPLDFSFQADLPASSGLGSSSAFSVGMVKLLNEFKGKKLSKDEIANEAIYIDRELMRENVGVQDHLHATHGGLNRFDLQKDKFIKSSIAISEEKLRFLENSMLLVHTGNKRSASQIAKNQIERISSNQVNKNLEDILLMVDEAHKILESGQQESFTKDLGELLNSYWDQKKAISKGITEKHIDDIYIKGIQLGAYGGKLCGAGGGGFMLFIINPLDREKYIEAFGSKNCVNTKIDQEGAKTLFSI
tara:strand:+ start:30114 stop:31136 length:1023 start_codon:yes stop_codon:yes gene_type:complete